ncbi:hypothetical protein Hanom_Chr05g00452111 [Helianthus anomalus]
MDEVLHETDTVRISFVFKTLFLFLFIYYLYKSTFNIRQDILLFDQQRKTFKDEGRLTF